MHNKRRLKRIHLIYYLRVFDNETKRQIGHLVDITTEGIMLISEEPVPIDRHYSLNMQLPGNITGREEINFQARCLWCRKDFNPDFHVAGYKIEKISSQEVKTITALISQYGFNG